MGWCLVRCLIFDLSISISVVSVDAVVDCWWVWTTHRYLKFKILFLLSHRTAMICKKSIVQKIADQRNGRI